VFVAVIGAKYFHDWADAQHLLGGTALGPDAEPPGRRSAVPAGGPTIERERAEGLAPPPSSPSPSAVAPPAAEPPPSAAASGTAAAAPPPPPPAPPAPAAADAGAAVIAAGEATKEATKESVDKAKGDDSAKDPRHGGKGEGDGTAAAATGEAATAAGEPDEEALLRDAVPDAESAVIGEEEAEAAGETGEAKEKGGATARSATKAKGPAKAATRAASAPGRVETVSVRITSTPVGAVVRTKHKVLGRTPINLHFRGDNIYELMFIKQGYAQATRRLAISGPSAKDRRLSVVLKKSAAARRTGAFHLRR